MFFPTRALLAASLLSVSTLLAAAEDSPGQMEETMVYGTLSRFSALKSDTPIMETARSVSIENLQQILDKGVLTLDEAYTYTSGTIGETFGFATRGDWVRVRGLQVPQYQDSLQSLFGNYNNARPDIYTLEQVEVLKGPASVLYGKGSPGGLVNVISKRPRAEANHEITAEAGNFDRGQIAFDSTGAIDSSEAWVYRVIGLYRDTETQVDELEEKTVVFAPSFSWRPGPETDVTVLLNYRDTESDTAAQFLPIAGTLLPAPNGQRIDNSAYLGDPAFNFYDTTTTSITLLGSHRFSETWSTEITSRYTDGEADYQQAWPSFIGGDRYIRNEDGTLFENGTVPRTWYSSDASSEQAVVDIRLRGEFSTGSLDHSVLMGSQYQEVETTDEGFQWYAGGFVSPPLGNDFWINVFDPTYGNVPDQEILDDFFQKRPGTESEDFGLYISDQISIAAWRITLGLRYDESETQTETLKQDDDAFSLGAGLLYQFDSGIAPYVSYSESFEPEIGTNGDGEPLKPREGEQIELGIKYQPENFPALITLAWFDLEQSNLPDPLSAPGNVQQQSGVAKIDGIELEALARIGDFDIELNLSKLDTEDPNGLRLASIPEEQASAWTTWRPQGDLSGFKAGAGIRYVGKSWDGLDNLKTPSYTLGDLMLGYEMEDWDVSLNVRNVSDKEYYATCLGRGDCFPGKERSIVSKLTYRF